MNPLYIKDLQDLLDESETTDDIVNDKSPFNLSEVDIVRTAPHRKTLEEQLKDMDWEFVRPNAYGNTGRYNKEGRACNQYYSDEFLKWYYGNGEKKK